jgi:hypothetical protein
MSDMERHRLMYGEWLVESDEERNLRTLAEQYHNRCEAYDRAVCSGISPRTGEAMPVDGHETGLVNRHARQVRAEILRVGFYDYGFTEEQVLAAIRNYSK